MGTLTALFDMTTGALVADQAALNMTGQNIANQNVPGYTREVATWQSGDTVTLSNGVSETTSAPVVTVSSVRSRTLDAQVQAQTQAQSATGAEAGVLSDIEGVFGISGSSASAGSTAIGTALNGLYSSFTALASDPADSSTRQGVLSAAQTLASAFNGAATQLSQIGSSLDAGLASSVAQVNTLTATIAQLNGEIGSSAADTAPGADAGTLEDRRQEAITQLSGLIGLGQSTTDGNGINLTTANGTPLVVGSQAFGLSAVTTANGTQIEDASGTNLNGAITGGSLGGQLAALTTDLPQVTGALDALAYRVATAVNTQNEAGVDLNGNPGAALFAVPASAAGAAAAIAVVATDPAAVAAAGAGEGTAGNANANALAAIENATGASGSTISGDLGTLLSQVGSRSAALNEQSTNQQATLTQLTTAQSTLSGVSLDDEAASLSTYQQSYEAAAKVFSILNTILADAINLGTETAVSA